MQKSIHRKPTRTHNPAVIVVSRRGFILSLLLLLATQGILPASESTVVANAGQSEVKAEDIKPLLEALPIRDQVMLTRNPAALNDFVRTLIIEQLVYKEALAKKWDQQTNVVALLERVRQQTLTQSYLQSLATPPTAYPSPSELQSAYEILKKNGALQVPRQTKLAQIFIASPKESDKSTDERARSKVEAVQKALKESDFFEVAKSQSEDPASAPKGGELGFLTENQIQGEIRSAIASLSPGKVTSAIRLKDGWHIIKVLEIKEPYTATLEEIKVPLTNDLRKQQAQALGKAYITKILQQNPVTMNEIAISKLMEKH